MKNKNSKKKNSVKEKEKTKLIVFEAPEAMVNALERIKTECTAVGMKMTDSMLVRICVANWMIKQGWIRNSKYAQAIATVKLP